jgi:N-methylhydantoinase A
MPLDVESARRAIDEHIATRLGVSIVEAAAGIVALTNENMATAARLHIAERGRDAARYGLFAFGGAGPVHAFGVARVLHLKRIICPIGAGTISALGFLVAPSAISLARTYVAPLTTLDWNHLERLFAGMANEANELITKTGVSREQIHMSISADMRYVGQGHEVEVSLSPDALQHKNVDRLREAFEDTYYKLFETRLEGVPVEALNWRLTSRGPTFDIPLNSLSSGTIPGTQQATSGRRPIYLPDIQEFVEAPVYNRYRLSPGTRFSGPAIVEERESTVVINGRATVEIDTNLNLITYLED